MLTIDLTEYTHYAPISDGWYICFTLETCENCGETIYNSSTASPNLNGSQLLHIFERYGLKPLDKLPPDIAVDFHDDDGGDEEWGCESCM